MVELTREERLERALRQIEDVANNEDDIDESAEDALRRIQVIAGQALE